MAGGRPSSGPQDAGPKSRELLQNLMGLGQRAPSRSREEQRQETAIRFEKNLEKLVNEGEKEINNKELKKRMQVVDELDKRFKEHQVALVEEQRERVTKKLRKEKVNEKVVNEDETDIKNRELKERMEIADELSDQFKKENKSGKLTQRIETMEVEMVDKDNKEEVALGTSRLIEFIHVRPKLVRGSGRDTNVEGKMSEEMRKKSYRASAWPAREGDLEHNDSRCVVVLVQ
ncbi:hypothetical protein BU16DRAFT_557473 [Lophium mytilinum]|uniref:Uncharacterized protein n=1 Tax=Lophium mytilinum TaxID=390894 RepID=A0A6A6R320_9PEZI|nr:hypothetical protein BU16DRAFT_557473 [Lophium mytilinum]